MKRFLFLSAALLAILVPARAASSWDIVAGQRIGRIHIGANASTELAFLGTPDASDGAAGHSWATWFSHTGHPAREVDVYSTLAAGAADKIVGIIRVTSPHFRTSQGLRIGSRLAVIQAAFPHAHLIATFAITSGAAPTRLYDDVAHGIAFEVRRVRRGTHWSRRCTAISVHRKGHSPTGENMPMPTYLQHIAALPHPS